MEPTNPLLIAFPLVWIGGVILASVLFRTTRDKPVFPVAPEGALYLERWGSGRNLSTWWGRLGGANNCLLIAVTYDSLTVAPRFPFNLMFLPEIYGLEFTMPLKAIASVERSRKFFKDVVTIRFNDDRSFALYPRRTDDFMTALRKG